MRDQAKRCLTIYEILFVLFWRSGERICRKLRRRRIRETHTNFGLSQGVNFGPLRKNGCTYGRVVVVLSFTIETVIPYRTICSTSIILEGATRGLVAKGEQARTISSLLLSYVMERLEQENTSRRLSISKQPVHASE